MKRHHRRRRMRRNAPPRTPSYYVQPLPGEPLHELVIRDLIALQRAGVPDARADYLQRKWGGVAQSKGVCLVCGLPLPPRKKVAATKRRLLDMELCSRECAVAAGVIEAPSAGWSPTEAAMPSIMCAECGEPVPPMKLLSAGRRELAFRGFCSRECAALHDAWQPGEALGRAYAERDTFDQFREQRRQQRLSRWSRNASWGWMKPAAAVIGLATLAALAVRWARGEAA